MPDPTHRQIVANGISIHVAEAGEGPPVLLCHGFPELWYSWRHQLAALARAGYRGIAPDQRGYGRTDRPGDVASYDIDHLAGDLIGLLDAIGEERAVVVGHDWGAIVGWHLAMSRPDRIHAVVGMSVPFLPRTRLPPIALMSMRSRGRFSYILYFQEAGPADRELARDPRQTLARVLWSASGDAPEHAVRSARRGTGWLDVLSPMPTELPSWLSGHDLDVYAAEFERTGFTGGLNWYRNMDRNWALTKPMAAATVDVPALFVAGARDPVLRMAAPAAMEGRVRDLRGSMIIPGAGHWIQQERPDAVTHALLRFLDGVGWRRP
jgi:pimeloyl-ACP methyl ester carboxylesterase